MIPGLVIEDEQMRGLHSACQEHTIDVAELLHRVGTAVAQFLLECVVLVLVDLRDPLVVTPDEVFAPNDADVVELEPLHAVDRAHLLVGLIESRPLVVLVIKGSQVQAGLCDPSSRPFAEAIVGEIVREFAKGIRLRPFPAVGSNEPAPPTFVT